MRVGDWYSKFACAFAGLRWALPTQNSFWVHFPIAIAVVLLSAWLQIESWRWIAIIVAITIVLVAEMFNTALEQLVQTLHPEREERIGRALDVAAGAVLIAAIASVAIGLISLGPPLLEQLSRWFG